MAKPKNDAAVAEEVTGAAKQDPAKDTRSDKEKIEATPVSHENRKAVEFPNGTDQPGVYVPQSDTIVVPEDVAGNAPVTAEKVESADAADVVPGALTPHDASDDKVK